MATVGYSGAYGAMAAYLGRSETLTNWPANMGGSDGVNAFYLGIVSQYLTGASQSTLKRRAVNVYSNVSSTSSFAARLTAPPAVEAPARIGPQLAFFPNRNGHSSSTPTPPY